MGEDKELTKGLSENALTVLKKRYLMRDEQGNPLETPENLLRRVADNIAGAERLYDEKADLKVVSEEFYQLMRSMEFLPNSPTLMNAGRELQQLSACFVLPVDDSMESIFESVKNAALIHKSGGGTGFSFSRIRPKNDPVKTTNGCASGPISFMKVFNAATEAVKQGGTRRGANMAILRVDHPDVMEFINCKQDLSELTNFNISVAITDAFMAALAKEGDYDLIHPRSKEIVGKLSAKVVFDQIVKNAWQTGEPGIVFIDRINAQNPTPHLGEIESTNPCGEQPLLPYEACNLGSINLAKVVNTQGSGIDYKRLRRVVHSAVHFLDNVIDVSAFPLPQIADLVKRNRKIGLGVMGFADLLLSLGVPYNSDAALTLAEDVMAFIDKESKNKSAQLAQQRGVFPEFQNSRLNGAKAAPLRNATTTTVAPTGTISIIAGTSSGVEPLFAVAFVRNVLDNNQLVEVNPVFKAAAMAGGFDSPELMQEIAEHGTVQGNSKIPLAVQKVFVTSHDITPEWHVKMQAAFQKYTDNAVSKTVNFPRSATTADVEKVFRQAFDENCKGVTIYRDGSREGQVLSVGKKETPAEPGVVVESTPAEPRERPDVISGSTEKMITGCGNLYITLNHDDRGLFEIFTQMGKSGGCAAAQSEAIARLVSLALRSGVNPEAIIKNLRGIRCSNPTWGKGGMVLSCPDAMGLAVESHLKRLSGQKSQREKVSAGLSALDQRIGACPECGGTVEHEGGCMVCKACGYSKCA